ncbi:MAG: hypothetical protein HPY70_11995 [Firmicutes bacterium]|jgi:hypothetical protein|nr:hypothetical protein [Bacillota bacterium]
MIFKEHRVEDPAFSKAVYNFKGRNSKTNVEFFNHTNLSGGAAVWN